MRGLETKVLVVEQNDTCGSPEQVGKENSRRSEHCVKGDVVDERRLKVEEDEVGFYRRDRWLRASGVVPSNSNAPSPFTDLHTFDGKLTSHS